MNKSYRVIFNHERNAWVAVAEITPAKGKSSCKSIVSTTVHAAVISAATIGATIAPTPATADTWTATQFGVYKNSTGEIFTASNNPFAIIPVKEETNGSRVYLNSDQTVDIDKGYKDDPSGGHVDVYGGYVPYNDSETRQNAEKNTVTIGENATVGVVYGGYTSSGEALGNTVNIGKSAEIGTVRGGKGYLSASGNTVSFIGYGKAVKIIGGEIDGNSPNTNASNNTVIIENFDPKGELLDVRGDVYGGKGNDTSGSNVENNTVTIIGKGTTIYGNVYGGADGKSINNNTVTIADGAVIEKNVYGAYNEYQLDGGVKNNTVNIEGGTVNGYVVGARISDKNKSSGHQTVNIKGGSVGSVYLSEKSSITGEVNLLSDENSVSNDLFGVVSKIPNSNSSQTVDLGGIKSLDDRDDYNVKLNLGSKDKRIPMNTYEVERVGAFTEYNFYLPPNVKDKDVALKTDKLLFRKEDVDVNVYIPGDAALEQNNTVYLIKTSTFIDKTPNITGNVYQGVTLQNNLGEVKIDDKDLILSMLKDNTSSTTPDPVPDPKVWNVSPNTYTTDVNKTPASFNGNFNAAKDTSKAIVNVSNDDYKGISIYGAKDNGTTNIAGAKNLGGIIDESNTSILNIDASEGSVQANSVKGWKEINFSNLSEKDPALALTQKADLGNKIKLSGSLNDYKKDGATFTLVKSENQVNVSDELFAENQITGKEFDILSSTQYKVDEFGFHQDADKKSLYINTEKTIKAIQDKQFNAAKNTSGAIVNVLPNDDYKGIDVYGAKDNGTTNIAGAKNLGGIIDESNTSILNIDASKGSVQANSVKGWKEIDFSNLSEKDPALALTQKADLGNKIKLSGSLNDYKKDGATFTLVESENQVNVSDELFAQNQIAGNEFNIQSSTQYTVDEFGFHQDEDKKSLYINTEKTIKAIQDKQFNGADGIENAIININTPGDFNGLNINAADKDSTINYVGGRNLGVIDGKNGTLNIGTNNKATAMNQRSAVDIKNIGDLNFYLPENIKNEDTALSLSATDKTDLSKTKVTAYLSGDSQINDKDVVHLIKKTNGGEISINDSNNKVTVKQGITLTSTQEMKLSDNKQNLDLIFAKASQDNEQPQGGDDKPQGGNEQPQGGNEQPQGGDDKPQGGNEQPQGGNEQPQGGDDKPQGGNEQPQGGNDKPQGGNEQLQGGDDKPQGGNEQSQGGNEQPQSGDDKPQGGNEQPQGGNDKPQGGNDKPQGGNDKPQGGNEQPQGGDDKPQGGNEQPQGGNEQPQGGNEQPQGGNEQPQGGNEQPQGGNEQPQGGNEQPQGGNEQPQGGNEQPQGGNEQPQGGNEQPQGGNEQPQGGNEQPQGGNEQPQGGDDKPQGGNEQPQGGDEQPQGGNEQPQGGDDKPQSGDDKPQGGNEQPQGGNEQPQGGNEQPQGGNEQPQGGNEQPQGGNEQPQGGDDKPQGGDDKPQGGNKPTVNEKTKSILETPLAAMALINRSSEDLSGSLDDMYATVGINSDVNNGAAFAFGGGIKERIDSGSHIDLKGGNVKIGYAHNVKSDSGKTLAGVFAEYGRGSYDSYLDDDTHGEGTTQHLGAGVFMNHTFNNDLYLQGSVKAGKVKSDYSSKDFGQHAYGDTVSYDTDSEYVGAHIGVGKVAHLSEDDSIDVYGKYFYTQTASEDIKLSSGETYNLDKVKSHRVRVGAKYKHEFDNSLGMFVGAAFEHEFDGTVNGTYRGYDLPSPSMKGNTGILEVGLTANKGDMKLDTSIQGYTGKRRGAGLNFKLRF